jgi:hypothetical protein
MCPMSHKSIALVADQLASILKRPLFVYVASFIVLKQFYSTKTVL